MRTLALTSALSAAAAAVGSLGPPVAFPLVWTPVYGLIAHGTGRLVDSDPESRGRLLALTTADLVVNASWNWAFFDRQSPRAGMAVIGVLNVLNVSLFGAAVRRHR